MRVFLCVLFCGLAGVSCSTIKKPFYWKIEKDGKTSYVLGTMHSGIDVRDMPEELHKDLAGARAVLLEITTESEKTNPYRNDFGGSRKQYLKQHERKINENIEKNITVKNHFSPEQWTQIEEQIAQLGVERSIIPYLTLPVISIFLRDRKILWVNHTQAAVLEVKPLDFEIEDKAIRAKKPLYRLDPLARMKQSCWDKMKVGEILFYLNHDDYDYVNGLVSMVDDYRTGDAELLLKKEKDYDKELDKCLLDERNAHWAPVIEKYHQTESPLFIAAGARHFIGEGNVLQLLEKMGYKVQRFPFK
jgi:uncharacterized protein